MVEDRIAQLTDAQKQCLRLTGEGLSSKEVAPHVGLTYQTVDQYLHKARLTLGAENRRQAARILREAESGEPFKKAELKSAPVADAAETAIVEQPVSATAPPKRWFGLPPIGGPSDDLTGSSALKLIIQLALMAAAGTAVVVLIYFWVLDLLVELGR